MQLAEYCNTPEKVAQLARACGVPADTATKWLAKGRVRHRLPTPAMAVAIWRATRRQVTPNDLYLPPVRQRKNGHS